MKLKKKKKIYKKKFNHTCELSWNQKQNSVLCRARGREEEMERTLSVKGSVFSHLPSTMGSPCVGEITIPWSFAPLGSRGGRGLSSRTRRLRFNCRASSRMEEDWISSPTASPYQILGIDPMSCSPSQLKAAFRARVKEYHPDVCKDMRDSDMIIKRVIRAYEVLLKHYQHESPDRTCLDPFEDPECEAYDLFVNEVLCVGKGYKTNVIPYGIFYVCAGCPFRISLNGRVCSAHEVLLDVVMLFLLIAARARRSNSAKS
ncbi:DnaJ domain-containing protein [Dioscorea alata]|uniref:DnaJ domain-containing protein n=1 Tax=Dioscorea alata TaxID=55571 RepID=A0ACB7VR98_DIOAL|nr:DnaJ domain-containing protein [Dioscorea alata]